MINEVTREMFERDTPEVKEQVGKMVREMLAARGIKTSDGSDPGKRAG